MLPPNRFFPIVFLLLLCALAGAQTWPDSAGVASVLANLGPLQGLSAQGTPAVYTRANLAQYGGADPERVFLYDYRWTVASVWKAESPAVTIAADVYCFGSQMDAFGAFSIDRKAGPVPPDIIALPGQASALAAYWAGTQLHVWRGPLYVRIVPASDEQGARAPVLALATAILGKLPKMAEDPGILRLPPVRDLLIESVKYQTKNVMGLSFLSNALTGTYGTRTAAGGVEASMQLVLMDAGQAAGAEAAFIALQAELSGSGPTNPVTALGEQAVAGRHPRYGQVFAMRQARYVAIAWQVADPRTAQTVLREVAKNIRAVK